MYNTYMISRDLSTKDFALHSGIGNSRQINLQRNSKPSWYNLSRENFPLTIFCRLRPRLEVTPSAKGPTVTRSAMATPPSAAVMKALQDRFTQSNDLFRSIISPETQYEEQIERILDE